jgi:hypothetical protein
MRLMVLALVSLLLASCGQVGNQGDDARQKGPARPEALEWTDGRGDMWAAKYVEPDGFVPKGPRPKSTNGDIRHVAVAHRQETLVIKVQYTDLDLEALKFGTPLRAFVDSNLGIESDIYIAWDGTARQQAGVNIFNGGGDVDCKGASASVDLEGNTATLSVPRQCLGLPRWVRVALESEVLLDNYPAEPAHMDSAMDAGFPANTRLDGTLIKRGLSERVYADSSSSPSGRGETTVLVSDPRGDVESMGPEGEDFSREATPAPQVKDGDILSTEVEHTATRLRIRVEFADMPRPSVNNYRLAAEVKTNAGVWGIDDDMEGSPVLLLGDGPVACDIDRSTDEAHRTSTLSIPRTCLGEDPAWVQIAVSLVTWQANGDATVDDAHVTGYDESTTFSRRVFKP